MVTRRSRAAPAPPPDSEFPADAAMPVGLVEYERDEIPENATDRVMALLSEVANDDRAKVIIYRKQAGTAKQAWCDEMPPADFEVGGIRMLRDKFGEGEYVIYLYGMKDGAFGIRTKAEVTISKSTLPPAQYVPPGTVAHDATEARIRELADLVRASIERPAPVPPDPMVTMRGMFSMMGAMREAMGLNTAQATPQKSSIAEMVDGIRELRAASELMGEGGGDDSLTGMVKSMLPVISQAMAAAPKLSNPFAPPPVPALGTPLGLPPLDAEGHLPSAEQDAHGAPLPTLAHLTPADAANEPAGDPAMPSEMLIAIKLKAYVATLLMWAHQDGPDGTAHVEKAGELIADKLPEEWLDLLDLPTWFELLVAQAPQMAPHQAWLTKARNRALELLDEADAAEGDAAAAAPAAPPPAPLPAKAGKKTTG